MESTTGIKLAKSTFYTHVKFWKIPKFAVSYCDLHLYDVVWFESIPLTTTKGNQGSLPIPYTELSLSICKLLL